MSENTPSNSELNSLASVFSHALRDPVRSILANCEAVSDPKLSLEQINGHANTLYERIEQLRHYSSLLGPIATEKLSLKSICHASWNDDVKHGVNDKITIGNLPEIEGCPKQIQQLFAIILQNSVDATEGKDADIEVEFDANSYINISDNGKGLEDYYKSIVFLPFQTLHEDTASHLGVGLFFARRIAANHGASIQYFSPEEGGCIFSISPLGC
jgi:signal transduction histidine kinase